jgi:hypothetical protein
MAFEQYFSYLYLEQSNRKKYGSILSGLSTQYSLGNDQYPKSMSEAVNVLNDHKFHPGYNLNNNRNNHNRNGTSEDQQVPSLSFAQLEEKCYCCGSSELKSPNCPHKN